MSNTIGRAVIEIGADDKEIKESLKDLKDQLRKTGDDTKGIGLGVNLLVFKEFAEVAGKAIGALSATIVDLGRRGGEVAALSGSFDTLSKGIGETGNAMLGATRTATKGLITDMEIMAASNKAMLLGLPVTSQSMATMAKAAVTLGRAMKQDAGKSMDDLITALGRSSPQILDNLGLKVQLSKAYEDFAKKANISVAALSDEQKQMAFYAAAMGAAEAKVASMGEIQLTFADHLKIVSVILQNFTDQLAAGISKSPALVAGLDALGKGLASVFGSNQGAMIQEIVRLVNEFAIVMAKGARLAIEAAQFVVKAVAGIRMAWNDANAAIYEGLAQAERAVASFAEKSSVLPVVGGKFKALAAEMNMLATGSQTLAEKYAQASGDVLKHTDQQDAALDGLRSVMTGVILEMEKAANTTAAAGVQQLGFAGKTEEAAKRSADAAQKIADAHRKLSEEIVMHGRVGIDARLQQLEFAKQEELRKAKELTGGVGAEYSNLTTLIEQKYAQQVAAAQLGSDEIRDKTIALQQELQLAQTTGLDQRLLQLDFARQRELAGIESLKLNYATQYEELRLLIEQKYAQMTAAAQGHGISVQQAATEAGFKTRAELEATAAKALDTYNRMKESGLYTDAQLAAAHLAAEKAKQEATGETKTYTLTAGQAILEGATQLFGQLGGRFKAAAIAGAIIATYQAVAKALASAPWPANLPLAAGALAAGMANVNKIRSSKEGFREGTPGLDFADFGRASLQPLHGREAVVPQGSGHILAREIAAAMPGDASLLDEIRAMRAELQALPQAIKRGMRDAMLQTA